MSFPTIVYRCPGDHHCAGGTYAYLGVGEQSQLDAALSDGWFLTLPEATAGEAEDASSPTRAELEAKAAELGVKFDGRTTDKALAVKIDAALAEQGE